MDIVAIIVTLAIGVVVGWLARLLAALSPADGEESAYLPIADILGGCIG